MDTSQTVPQGSCPDAPSSHLPNGRAVRHATMVCDRCRRLKKGCSVQSCDVCDHDNLRNCLHHPCSRCVETNRDGDCVRTGGTRRDPAGGGQFDLNSGSARTPSQQGIQVGGNPVNRGNQTKTVIGSACEPYCDSNAVISPLSATQPSASSVPLGASHTTSFINQITQANSIITNSSPTSNSQSDSMVEVTFDNLDPYVILGDPLFRAVEDSIARKDHWDL